MKMTNMDNDGMNMMNMKMQPMSFYWGSHAIVLFSRWPDQRLGMYILSLFLVFSMAVAAEILSVPAAAHKAAYSIPFMEALSRACVYALRIVLSYLVMLSLMSFNVGIFIVAVAGHAVGFFVVKATAFKRSKPLEEDYDEED